MPGSEHSDDSNVSNASSYRSVDITEMPLSESQGSQTQEPDEIRSVESDQPVPDDAPPLPPGGLGVYRQNTGEFFAVHPEGYVARWNAGKEWIWENRQKLARAVLDVSPSFIQGASAFVPEGTAHTVVKGAGILAQAGVGIYDLVGQAKQHRAGGQVDWPQITTSMVRILSAGANTFGEVGNKTKPITGVIDGLGNWGAGAATGVDGMRHSAQPGPQRLGDVENQLYAGMHQHTQVGTEPGQYPPGVNPPTQPSSSTSSFEPHVPIPVPAQDFNPPVTDAGRSEIRRRGGEGDGPVDGNRSRDNSPAGPKAKRK
ncbi:hypothetical protein [Streptomyces sp. NPDC093544]|jgi:hypothetical protein|uniref:hypothetical protein n=1 Tax=Streptomyces sp. NPDC093544 TaxID=3155200 RepID=UPI00343D309D